MTSRHYTPLDPNSHPPLIQLEYKSTRLRGPTRARIPIDHSISEITGPTFAADCVGELDHDLTQNSVKSGSALGERIIVAGKVQDESGLPLPNTLIEIWQANAAGRYIHLGDQHDAPVDPNFLGAGRCMTDDSGEYRFLTIKPGAYPWPNHDNAWRPAHIHLSLFGPAITTRLITQFYFPGDPLLAYDPIFLATPESARERLIAQFSLELTEPNFALGYQFDIVLRSHLAPTTEEL